MGDFRISVEVKVDLAPASATKAEQKRDYEHVPPLSMWLNYNPDCRDEIVESITTYLDKAWAAARWNLDTAYREYQERQKLQDKIKRAGVLKTDAESAVLTDAEIEAEGQRRFPHWEWASEASEYDDWVDGAKWARDKAQESRI